jgi:hypothetical protein
MTLTELRALETMTEYLLENERISYLEYIDEGGEPEGHIYTKAKMLDEYVRGLYLTWGEAK